MLFRLFDIHEYKPKENDPDMLVCLCGNTKNIHQHIWENYKDITDSKTRNVIGKLLKCQKCGDLKEFKLTY